MKQEKSSIQIDFILKKSNQVNLEYLNLNEASN